MSLAAATVESVLESLTQQALDRAVPHAVARTAVAATQRAFSNMSHRVISVGERRRVTAYFNAVVRRRVIRGRDGRQAASRAVLAAVVADLRSVGCGPQRIADELERGWRGQVPDDVLDEMRLGLVS